MCSNESKQKRERLVRALRAAQAEKGRTAAFDEGFAGRVMARVRQEATSARGAAPANRPRGGWPTVMAVMPRLAPVAFGTCALALALALYTTQTLVNETPSTAGTTRTSSFAELWYPASGGLYSLTGETESGV